MSEIRIIPRAFYRRSPLLVAKDLVGKSVTRRLVGGKIIRGVIVETEAYGGLSDPASHAFKGQTKRNEAMFGEEGHAYVYFTYGFHYCLNFVTRKRGRVGAVLIRALEPTSGLKLMKIYRGTNELIPLTNGPGKLCQALAIDLSLDKTDITDPCSPIFVSSPDPQIITRIKRSARVGITVATERKWRFYDSQSQFVSRARLIYPISQKKFSRP